MGTRTWPQRLAKMHTPPPWVALASTPLRALRWDRIVPIKPPASTVDVRASALCQGVAQAVRAVPRQSPHTTLANECRGRTTLLPDTRRTMLPGDEFGKSAQSRAKESARKNLRPVHDTGAVSKVPLMGRLRTSAFGTSRWPRSKQTALSERRASPFGTSG